MRKVVLMLICLLAFSMLSVVPVSAKKGFVYNANGKLEQYDDAWSSEILNGHWNVKIREDDSGLKVCFKAFYRELNNDEIENSPVGTIDIFKLTLTDYDSVEIDEDLCTMRGSTIHVKKKWWNLATGKPEPDEWDWYNRRIRIDESEIFIDLKWTLGQDWDIRGPTLSIHY